LSNSAERESVNILLVEDDEMALQLVSVIIKGIGNINLFTASNGKEGLAVAKTTKLDLVITDIMMPVMDGFELIKQLREMPATQDVHIIIITALQYMEQKIRGLELGANDYITKPFDYNELKARIVAGIRTVKLRKQLKYAYSELKKAAEFKRLLLGRVAHDLRTPISIIEGYLHLIRDSFDNLSHKEFESYFNNIMNQSRYINSICRDMLDFTAIDMGKLSLNLSLQYIEKPIQEAIVLNRPQAQAKGLTVNLEIEDDLPQVKLDIHRITGVFWNILNNAIKYSNRDSFIDIRAFRNEKGIEISFADHGRGISVPEMRELFDFFASKSEKDDIGVGSVGLGLAISKKLVELHNGDLGVKSEQGRGSTFTVCFPIP